ncbi:hypothetical protein CN279_04740 [Bacillus anthracis]|nr:hypothetical protein CN279_04740 [Bacillus anthracis]
MRKRRFIRKNNFGNTSDEEKSIFNFSDMTIYISIITALGYFVSYSYKKGYRSYYGLNEVLINQIDLSSILLSITFIFSTLAIFLGIYNNAKILFLEYDNIFFKVFEKKVFVVFCIYLLFNFLYSDQRILIFTSFAFLMWIITIYILPIILYRDIEGYRNKLKKSLKEKSSRKNNFYKLIYLIKNDFKSAIIPLFTIFFLCINFSGLLGISNAKKQKDYYILKDKNITYVIIDSYSDKFIIAPINLKTNTIKKKFLIIEGKSNLKEPLVFEKIRINDGINY